MDMSTVKSFLKGACFALAVCSVIYTTSEMIVWIATHMLKVCLK